MSGLRSFAAIFTLTLCAVAAHADSLIGSTVDVEYLYPDTGTVTYNSGTQTVTSGLTDTDTTDGVSVTFAADQITITNLFAAAFTPAAFNGVDVTFLSGTTLTDVTIDPSSTSDFESGSVLAFTGDTISLNLAGTCLSCNGGETIVLDVDSTNTSVTPEPSSLVLVSTGLLGLAALMRRRFA